MVNERQAAIAAELQWRGLLNADPSGNGSVSSVQPTRKEAIRAELERRGLVSREETPSEKVISPSPTLWDRVKQFGEGMTSGAHGSGVSMGLGDPFMGMTPQGLAFKKRLKEEEQARLGEEAEALKKMDTTGRILHKAGEWTSAAAPIPGGQVTTGVKMLPFFAKFAGKQLLKDAAVGAGVGGLEEAGVNPLVAAFAVPGAVGIGKGVKKAGQYIVAPREQKTAHTLNKIYRNKASDIGETRPVHEAFNVPAALEELHPTVTATEAGTQLRDTLAHELETRKGLRTAETQPLYDAVKKNTSGHPLPETRELIEDLLLTNSGDTRKAVQEVKKELSSSNIRLTPMDRAKKEHMENYLKNNPAVETSPVLMEELKKAYPYQQMELTAHEINNRIKQVIDPKLKTSDESLKKELLKIKESLLKETASVPELHQAREAYGHLSEPVNKIKRHPLLKLAVQKDAYGKYYTFGESDLPKQVIDPSLHSVHHATDLLNEIRGHKNTLDATRGYIHTHIINAITDGYGKVSHEKLQGWKRKNPGAFVIDPSLETKLKNLSNSQYLVNQARLKINNASLKDTFTHFGLKAGAKFLPSFVGKDKIIELLSFKLADDIQGKDELIMKLIQSSQFKQLLETSPRQTPKMNKLVKTLEPAMRNVLITAQQPRERKETE